MLQSQYKCHSARVFVLNTPTTFAFLWKTVQHFLEEHTKKKLQLHKSKTCPDLLAMVHPS